MSKDKKKVDKDDAELLKKFYEGDKDAFTAIIEKYHVRVYRLAYKFTRNQADAEDVTQDTFMRAYENLLKHPKDELALKAWLMTICVNLTRNLAKKKKNINFSNIGSEDDDREFVDSIEDVKIESPGKRVKRKETTAAVQEAIGKLPAKYQVVLQLRYVEDLSYQEIADTLDIPMNTVKIHLKRAKDHMKGYLNYKTLP
jgi:RNA polymerase sigma-70 factor, ECF subfamily